MAQLSYIINVTCIKFTRSLTFGERYVFNGFYEKFITHDFFLALMFGKLLKINSKNPV